MGAWLDGDGFVDKKGVHWSSVNKHVILQGRDLLASIGISSSIYKMHHKENRSGPRRLNGLVIKPSETSYSLNVSHFDSQKLLQWSAKATHSLIYLSQQKRTKPPSMRLCLDGNFAYRIKRIEDRYVENIQTYNVEVAEDESYTLAGLVSHNCTVPEDFCSICNNAAKSRKDYCVHLKQAMNAIFEDGRQVYAINKQPTFFDLSKVNRGADRIAYSLRKVASDGVVVKSGAEAAEEAGLIVPIRIQTQLSRGHVRKKMETLQKLALIESHIDGPIKKDIPAVALGDKDPEDKFDDDEIESDDAAIEPMTLNDEENGVLPLFGMTRSFDPDVQQMDRKAAADLSDNVNDIWSSLTKAQVSLPARDFFNIVMRGGGADKIVPEVEEAAPNMFNRIIDDGNAEEICSDDSYDSKSSFGALPSGIMDIVKKLTGGFSLGMGPSKKRVTIAVIRKGDDAPRVKVASNTTLSKEAAGMLKEYAKYKLSLAAALDDENAMKLMILQNHVGV